VKLHYKNKIYETLVGKGFQRTTKKNKNETNGRILFLKTQKIKKEKCGLKFLLQKNLSSEPATMRRRG